MLCSPPFVPPSLIKDGVSSPESISLSVYLKVTQISDLTSRGWALQNCWCVSVCAHCRGNQWIKTTVADGAGEWEEGEQKTGSSLSRMFISVSLSLLLFAFLKHFSLFRFCSFLPSFLPHPHTLSPTYYQSFVIPELMPSRATVAINKLKCVQPLALPEALDRRTHHTINIQTLNTRLSAPVTWFNTQPYMCIQPDTCMHVCVCVFGHLWVCVCVQVLSHTSYHPCEPAHLKCFWP